MTACVVKLNPAPTMADALGVVDALRKGIEEGRVIAFAVTGVGPNDDVIAYCSSVRSVSRLRMQGAMAQYLHDWMSGEV